MTGYYATLLNLSGESTRPTTRDQEAQDIRIDQMALDMKKRDADLKWAAPKFAATIAVAVAATGATMTYFAPHPPPAAPAPNVTINIPSQPAQEPPPDPCRCPAGIDPGSKPMTPPDAEMSCQESASGMNDFLTRVEALREEYDTIKPTRHVIGADDGMARVPISYY